MKKVYLLPNVITAFGLSCGLFVIFKMCITPAGSVTQELLTAMAGIFLLAALADLLDGIVARVMKAESEFGGIFDSLSDSVSFGIAPAVLILKTVSSSPLGEFSFLTATGAMLFSVCGILRLARYNVLAHRSKEDTEIAAGFNKNFTGLPIPAAAAAAISMNLLLVSSDFKSLFQFSEGTHITIIFIALLLLGYCMVSRWKFPSLKTLNLRVASFQAVLLTVVPTLILFYGLLHHFAVVFFGISWFYIAVAFTLSIVRLISGRKSKTLEDFEPEEENEQEDL
jgi:CDP-diacylglycerol--serine O-phosphatidyltransferase